MQYWQPGTRINNDKYIVEQILGSGGFGITYKVRESRKNKQFAIKTLNYQRQQLTDFEQLQQKFINEALALAGCRHPNIVCVYPQMFQESGLWCMVMEYVEGQNLADYLDGREVFSEQEAIDLITKVGSALSHVHQQGFLHRDIKPANILLRSSDLSPILIDFGLAREYSPNTTGSMTVALTECYAPIEQYQTRGNFGAWTDVYALAATLYKMVTGIKPMPSRCRINAKLQTPQEINPNISDRLNIAILRGMELELEKRPDSVNKWLKLLSYRQKQTSSFQSSSEDNLIGINANKNAYRQFSYPNKKETSSLQKHFTENLGGATSIKMMYIPGGKFMMGTSSYYKKCISEYPQHEVKLKPFYISQYPVTQAQYEAIMGENPSMNKGFDTFFGKKRLILNKEKYRNLPVDQVKWSEAIEFCSILSSNTRRIYQLPSESQWEYACRAGTETQYYFGDEASRLRYYGWYGDWLSWLKRLFMPFSSISSVGQKKPNRWNLYDMHGLVFEWCQDDWHYGYENAPQDGNAWLAEGTKHKKKVIRGGSHICSAIACRSASRNKLDYKFRSPGVGFRIVCTQI